MTEPNIPLPKAPILGYLSNVSTPTRVRIIAARYIFWIGVLFFVVSAILFFLLATDLWHVVIFFRRGAARTPSLQEFIDFLKDEPGYIILFFLVLVFLFTPAITFVSFAAPIRRGRPVPSIIATIFLIPYILFIMFITATFFGTIVLEIFSSRHYFEINSAPGLLLLPIPVLIVLLMKDLCAFLIWIARHPTTEKPPMSFLPTASQAPKRT